MHLNHKELFWAVFLGLILPGILFSFATGKRDPVSEPTQPQGETVAATTTAQPQRRISVKLEDGAVTEMLLEDYITSVVLREMPATFHMEALKAQAVVARTYTVRRNDSNDKHPAAQVCADSTCCQGYWDPDDYLASGGTEQKLEKVRKAVEDTQGLILVYNGDPIEATYFSCSGGSTEDAVAVWGSDVPYLKATKSPGEEHASHYTDTEKFNVLTLAGKLGIQLSDARKFSIDNITYTAGGGVDTIVICGKSFSGTQVRKLLNLRSTAFIISAAGNNVTITTKGHGHRVGMSQYGADAMASDGQKYMQILLHYYQGVELVSMSELY